MYKTYFGLKENPFSINTDPRYLYMTQRTQQALSCLAYGIESRKGFILLTGEVGTGKTTLLNKLLESLHQQGVATAFVFNARLTDAQFFDYMLADFGIACKSRMKSQVLFTLHQWLLNRYQAGEQTVLVVDEAQNLSRQTLEEIRLLTNMETSTEKLLHIVLAGQPELEKKLDQRELRQLRQRIALRAETLPLTAEETCGYILERLRIAGSNGEAVFTPAAIEAVHRHARGIPRVTNMISEHALVRGFLEQRKPVPAEIVDDVARDFKLDEAEETAEPAPTRRLSSSGRRRKQAPGGQARRNSRTNAEGSSAAGQPAGITQAKLPLFVYGYGPENTPFYEQAYTIATNARGGLICMQSTVQPGQRLLITNKENECSQECMVEFVGARLARGVDVGFEFSEPAPQFWATGEIQATPASADEQACA
jgi:type II secretory pathway predicted ATPase ExeA